jgi:hypothetical protein
VSADPLRRRVHHDVGAVLDGAHEVAASTECVIDLWLRKRSFELVFLLVSEGSAY